MLLAENREDRDLVAASDVNELNDGRDRRGCDDHECADRGDRAPKLEIHERSVLGAATTASL